MHRVKRLCQYWPPAVAGAHYKVKRDREDLGAPKASSGPWETQQPLPWTVVRMSMPSGKTKTRHTGLYLRNARQCSRTPREGISTWKTSPSTNIGCAVWWLAAQWYPKQRREDRKRSRVKGTGNSPGVPHMTQWRHVVSESSSRELERGEGWGSAHLANMSLVSTDDMFTESALLTASSEKSKISSPPSRNEKGSPEQGEGSILPHSEPQREHSGRNQELLCPADCQR